MKYSFIKGLIFLSSVFLITSGLQAQEVQMYKLQDVHGNIKATDWVKRYRDTLVFKQPSTSDRLKIALNNIQSINGKHPDSAGLRNHPYPTELRALNQLRYGQLGSFWIGLITGGVIAAYPDFVIPNAAVGGGVSTIVFLSSYGGIRRLIKYRKLPVVLRL
jgi:hypothetical protein